MRQIARKVAAHVERVTMRLRRWYPEHEPRAQDPHYDVFRAARERMRNAGLLVCWRCRATKEIELHHAFVEWALRAGVDVSMLVKVCPEFHVTDEESFARWINSEGNLLPLCRECHRGRQGIHRMDYPSWAPGRFWRAGYPAPCEVDEPLTQAA